MKKCKGCGAKLQNIDQQKEGFVNSLDQDYCQRCFRLTHYGDIKSLKKEVISNNSIKEEYQKYKDEVFALIIDGFDALNINNDDLLDYFKDQKLIIIINKIDLLPYSVKDEKMEDIYTKLIKKLNNKNIIGCLLTYKNDQTFNNLFYDTLKEYKLNKIVFVGRVNAGKSTIINKLLNNNDLTVSSYPGTTIHSNEIECNGFTFIDTPGLIDENSFISLLDKELVKHLIPNKCVKPKVFQVYENESYSIEGLIDFDVLPKNKASIVFFINNNLEIHRTKTINIDNFINKHFKDYKLNLLPLTITNFKIDKYQMFYIKGLGFIKINGNSNLNIRVHNNVKIYKCGVNL